MKQITYAIITASVALMLTGCPRNLLDCQQYPDGPWCTAAAPVETDFDNAG